MSYKEIINRTDYTESELINLALTIAICFYKNCRDNTYDYDFRKIYDNMCIALEAIKARRNQK